MKLRLLVASSLALGGLVALPGTAAAVPGCEPLLDGPTPAQELFTDAGRVEPGLSTDEREAVAVAADVLDGTRELAAEAVADDTLHLDPCGAPFVVEDAPGSAAAAGATPNQAVVPLDRTFTLHSRPSASRTIYLDVHGSVTTGTAWNNSYGATITSPAYSTDADPAFSAAELTDVQTMWQIVAQDFAAFDVDVTTERPAAARLQRSSSTDREYGFRAVITPTNEIGADCRCGGIAYIDTPRFSGSTYDRYGPAFVFTDAVGRTAYNAAQAISHEVGHNLSLLHDGTVASGSTPARAYYSGHGLWAPIMGASYGRPVSQWSRGDYAGADNPQDDLALIGRYLPTLPDAEGDTAGDATALTGTLSAALAPGDVDHFRLDTAGGRTVVDLAVPAHGNVDAKATLTTASGEVVEVADPVVTADRYAGTPPSGLGLRIDRELPAGRYLLKVEGAAPTSAPGPYPAYGSVGPYTLSLQTTQPPTTPTSPPPTTPALTITSAAALVTDTTRRVDVRLRATGGDGAVTWSATGLPAGLSVVGDRLVGRVTTAGRYRLTLHAASGTATARRAVSLLVRRVPPRFVTRSTLPTARAARTYRATVRVVSPYRATWRLRAGRLPAGVSWRPSADGRTVVLTGRPRATGSHRVMFRAASRDGVVTRVFTVRVARR